MPTEQLSTEGDHEYRAGDNDYAQLKAEQEAGLNQVTDPAKAEKIAYAAKTPVEANIDLAQAAEADAHRLKELSASPESRGAPLIGIEQIAANVATGQQDTVTDRAGLASLEADARMRDSAGFRDDAEIELNYAERVLDEGEAAAGEARKGDERDARDRAIGRTLEDSINQATARLDQNEARLTELKAANNPEDNEERQKLNTRITADRKTLTELNGRVAVEKFMRERSRNS